jgi:hypothetical protein
MKQRMVLGLSALVLSLIAVAPAGAVAKTTTCSMDYDLKSWSAFYKTAKGSGTITCDNGQTATAKLSAKGGGLTAGKSVVRDGHGKFSEVADISELFGSYVNGSAAAGAGKSSEAGAMTKGEVSLALAGKGTGVELGVSFGKFTITRR